MTISQYTQYFQHIAETFTEIGTFLEADLLDMDSFAEAIRQNTTTPLVFCLEPYVREASNTPAANNHDMIKGAFVVLDKLDTRQRRLLSNSARAELAALAIRSRMVLDYETQCNILAGLQTQSFSFDQIGIFLNNWTGWRVEFALHAETRIEIEPGQWPNYTPYHSIK